MPSDDTDDKDLPPSPLDWLREKRETWRKFVLTRRMILDGEPLYLASRTQLRTAGYMNWWEFQLAESAFAALPVPFLLAICSAILPPADNAGSLEARAAVTVSKILPIFLPFLTLALAELPARGSFHVSDLTDDNVRRNRRVYLYLQGAWCFAPELIGGSAWAIASAILARKATVFSDSYEGPAGVICVVAYVIAVACYWRVHRIIRAAIPMELFKLNGYSARKRRWFSQKLNDDPPWRRYAFFTGCAVPFLICAFAFSLAMLAVAIAEFSG